MKLAIQFGVSTYTSSNEDWASALTYAVEAERLGIDSAWTAETWGYDGATPLAYLAAKTTRIRLGTGILQVGARTPTLTAMTAMALASLSGDRFLLGLGVSGPQVIEGWHGVRFARPLQRLRETVEIVRRVTRRDRTCLCTWQRSAPKAWSSPVSSPMAGSALPSSLNMPPCFSIPSPPGLHRQAAPSPT